VFVDPPLNDYLLLRSEENDTKSFTLTSHPFLGGREDFLDPPSFFEESQSVPAPTSCGLFEDLLTCWTRETPEGFNPESPSLLSLAYYPLKIIAGEWMNYAAVMSFSIKRYEYTVEDLPILFPELDKLNSDLRTLQSWRRRSIASRNKIASVARFLHSHRPKSPHTDELWTSLVDDYEHIDANIKEYSYRLENMLPIVTAVVQVVDTRRSFAETANVSRLTYLALVFVPLTFTTGLFSMNIDTAPGGKNFWAFFLVAIPVTVVVFLIARPPARNARWLYDQGLRLLRNAHLPR
jgi:Mg2+ and Co2+ transporter CorA